MSRNIGKVILLTGAVLVGAVLASSARASLNISRDPTRNVACSNGVCAATAKQAVLNVDQLQSMLASADVDVRGGSGAKNVVVSAPLSWASNSRLTLAAPHSIVFERLVTISGSGALTLTFNEHGTTGTLSFVKDGRVVFWDLSSSLVINGATYTLVSDIGTLAADIAANPSGNYALAKNYDASIAGTYAHSPIPTTYNGVFEGLGNTIANFAIHGSRTENAALFSALGPSGTIENLSMSHVLVRAAPTTHTGLSLAGLVAANSGHLSEDFVGGKIHDNGGHFVGALAGSNQGLISNCGSAGTIEADGATGVAGGLVGANSSSVVASFSTAAVYSGGAIVGGLVGRTASGSIVDSHATGAVTAECCGAAGGLVGQSLCCTGGLSITDSYATGAVSGYTAGGLISNLLPGETISGSHATGTVASDGTDFAGGLVGDSSGTIINSYASGDVSLFGDDGGGGVGGLAGASRPTSPTPVAAISSSFATGNVTGIPNVPYMRVGGLVGLTSSHTIITGAYATGDAKAGEYVAGLIGGNENARITQAYETGVVSQGQVPGGAVGRNYESDPTRVSSTYWDSTTSGQTKGIGKGQTYGIIGLTDDQLKSGLPGGFDPSVWAENPNINNGYPYLIANPPPQ